MDQTTRIYGELYHSDVSKRTWHEIARPQVHGYDLLDAVFLDPLKFMSIADEKVVRVFEAPRNFVQLAKTLDVAYFSESEVGLPFCPEELRGFLMSIKVNRPAGASVPPLGLSNKAIGDGRSAYCAAHKHGLIGQQVLPLHPSWLPPQDGPSKASWLGLRCGQRLRKSSVTATRSVYILISYSSAVSNELTDPYIVHNPRRLSRAQFHRNNLQSYLN